MPDPGLIGSQVPPGPGEVWKQIKDAQRQTQQALSFAASAQAVSTQLAANVAQLAASGATWAGPVSTTGTVAAGPITGTSVAVTGAASSSTVTTTGVATIGGVITADAGVSSLDVRNTTVITNRAAVWADVTGRMGNSSSSVSVKQDFAPADIAAKIDALLHLGLLDFRRIDQVEEFGNAAPVELGSIVEYVAGTPLAGTTFTDPDGNPQGINWVDMIPVMIATIQEMHARIVELENPTV